jgi:hypothetical protein
MAGKRAVLRLTAHRNSSWRRLMNCRYTDRDCGGLELLYIIFLGLGSSSLVHLGSPRRVAVGRKEMEPAILNFPERKS